MDSYKKYKFQIIDWFATDIDDNENNEDSDNSNETKFKEFNSEYIITAFGKDLIGKTYSLKIKGFYPYFYIKVPNYFTSIHITKFIKWLKNGQGNYNWKSKNPPNISRGLGAKYKNSFINAELLYKYKFRGFTNNKQFKFLKLIFKNKLTMRRAISLFQNKIWDDINKKYTNISPKKILIKGIDKSPIIYHLYENMIDPLIRFLHISSIKPTNWISTYAEIDYNDDYYTNYNLKTKYEKVKFYETDDNVKIKIMAYDIECDSSHGDFPLPIKDYIKLSREICIEYERLQKLIYYNNNNLFNINLSDYKKQEYINIIKNPTQFLKIILENALICKYNGYSKHNISKVYTKIKLKNFNNINLNNLLDSLKEFLINFKWYHYIKNTDRNKLFNETVYNINQLLNSILPEVEGDKTIQIGCSFIKYGENKPYRNIILTLDTCDQIENTEVEIFKSEYKLLQRFKNLIIEEDPEIITGYNILGFDTPWLWKRAKELNYEDDFSKISRIRNMSCKIKKRQIKSSVGELITIEFVDIPGRVQLDIFKLVQKSYNLNSYKLDNVAAHFIQGNVKKINNNDDSSIIYTDNLKGLNIGNYIIFIEKDGYLDKKYLEGKKFRIIDIINNKNKLVIEGNINLNIEKYKCIWCLGKDDVSPQDIFKFQKGSSYDRSIIAKYCMMDVILCIELLNKLEFITNNICMSNVCLVPFNWVIHRGQGVKILSLVSDILKKKNYLLPFLYKNNSDNDGYEGAIVLKPYPGIYLEQPVAVLDYASLYPSSMIMGNLSHETIVFDDKYLGVKGAEQLKNNNFRHYDVDYDIYHTEYTKSGNIKSKKKTGIKTVRYVQYPSNIILNNNKEYLGFIEKDKDNNLTINTGNNIIKISENDIKSNISKKAIIPETLQHLLNARKQTRKKIKYKSILLNDNKLIKGIIQKQNDNMINIIDDNNIHINILKKNVVSINDTYNRFQKGVLEGLQLAFKITANSLYGQIGAKVSNLYLKEIAASTTAIGRKQLEIAQIYCENKMNFKKKLNNGEIVYLQNKVVYGDTDSVFVAFDCRNSNGKKMKGKDALSETIKLAVSAEKGINKILMKPQDLEYEKTFWPFILFTKKKYVGNKYEHDINKYKQTAMGIVLKRRDNAAIVKIIFGGIIDSIMKTKKIKPSLNFLQQNIKNLINKKFPMESLIITKTLSGFYKNPDRIAHKVLADRIAERDPGNKPQINDRIPFVYIKGKKIMYVNTTYLCLNNENMAKYIIINKLTKKSNNYKIIISDNYNHYYNNDLTIIIFTISWNWNKSKDKGYNIEFISENQLFYTILEDNILQYISSSENKEKTYRDIENILFINNKYNYQVPIVKLNKKNFDCTCSFCISGPSKSAKKCNKVKTYKKIYKTLKSLKNKNGNHIIQNYLDVYLNKKFKFKKVEFINSGLPNIDSRLKNSLFSLSKLNPTIFSYTIKKEKKNILQSNKIENPKYITDNNLEVDFEFYITNQIKNPISQIYALCISEIYGYQKNWEIKWAQDKKKYINDGKSEHQAVKKILEKKQKEVSRLLFSDFINKINNVPDIRSYFSPQNNSACRHTRLQAERLANKIINVPKYQVYSDNDYASNSDEEYYD